MPRISRFATAVLMAVGTLGTAAAPSQAGEDVEPLLCAHAHNDYEHDRPLFDALDHGFTSVEVDVWLVDGQLLVGHDRTDLKPSRTLQNLYLDPLMARVKENGGSVYRGEDVPLQLLVDIKNTGEQTYTALDRVLRRYETMLTRYTPEGTDTGAVTAVISGDRPRELMESQRVRYAGYDGRLDDLDGTAPASFMPLISDRWTTTFTWQGVGPMPAAEREELHRIARTAHSDAKQVRFWATPDQPLPNRERVWKELVAADVDWINTDDLAGLERFLRERGACTAA